MMRASLILKATVSSAAATAGMIAIIRTANRKSPTRLDARISPILLDPFTDFCAHRERTRQRPSP